MPVTVLPIIEPRLTFTVSVISKKLPASTIELWLLVSVIIGSIIVG